MWDYPEKVMEHFKNPHNMGTLENANAIGQVGSIVCGDALKLFLRIENRKIVDVRFQTFGCTSAIASSSALTDMLKGKTIEEALAITNDDIVATLGGLPPEKMHCSVMGREALETAIANYEGKTIHHKEDDEGRLICRCFGVTENRIRRHVIENKLRTVQDVINYTKAGGGCTSCHADIQDVIDDVWQKELAQVAEKTPQLATSSSPTKLNNFQKVMRINQILNDEVKPTLAIDGGSIELVDVVDNVVTVKLHGACGSCACGTITLKGYVERILKDKVSPELQVMEVK